MGSLYGVKTSLTGVTGHRLQVGWMFCVRREGKYAVVGFGRDIGIYVSNGDGAEGDFEMGCASVGSQGYGQSGKGTTDVIVAVAMLDLSVASDRAGEDV